MRKAPTSATRNVGVKIRDKDGDVTEYTDTVTISNAAPNVEAATDQSADKGRSFYHGSFYDAADDGPWEITVNWGDGSSNTNFQTDVPRGLPAQHTYTDNGTYTVAVKVAEAGGTPFGSNTFQVTVANLSSTFAKEPEGRVPQYEAREASYRECPYQYNTCFYVQTEADNEQSLVLIVQDIIQSHNLDAEPDTKVVWFQFDSPTGDKTLPWAYAFRDEALVDQVLSEDELRHATVINGVYLVPSDY